MEKIKILIVEDELIIAEDMKFMLSQKYEVTGTAINYEEAIHSMKTRLPDLILIDINLIGTKTGIDLAHTINTDFGTPFIFLTSLSDEETMKNAKEMFPYAYLIKPFEKRNLFSSIEIALHNATSKKFVIENQKTVLFKNTLPEVFFVKKGNYYIKLKSEEIDYIIVEGNYLDVISNKERYTIRSTLKDFQEQLSQSNSMFLQVHRSYMVNIKKVTAIAADHVLINDEKIPLSKMGRESLNTLIHKLS
jgi:two-component system response regulator LytT